MPNRRRPSILLALAAGTLLSAAAVNATSDLRVVDGDSIVWGWRVAIEPARYRLAGYDAPETRGAKCAEERTRGAMATKRLRRLVAGKRPSLHILAAREKYGRGVASLRLGDDDAATIAIREGWGRAYDGRSRRAGWCGEVTGR